MLIRFYYEKLKKEMMKRESSVRRNGEGGKGKARMFPCGLTQFLIRSHSSQSWSLKRDPFYLVYVYLKSTQNIGGDNEVGKERPTYPSYKFTPISHPLHHSLSPPPYPFLPQLTLSDKFFFFFL